MSTYNENIIHIQDTSKMALGFLAAMVVFGLFVVGYDQGHLFSLVQGSGAFDMKYLHEFTHDIRHASGFPCH
jgi:cobalt transporter subunit CbtB